MFLNAYLNLSSLSSRIPLSLYLCLSTVLASLFSHLPLIPLAPLSSDCRFSSLSIVIPHSLETALATTVNRLGPYCHTPLADLLFPRLDALLLPAETISCKLLLRE